MARTEPWGSHNGCSDKMVLLGFRVYDSTLLVFVAGFSVVEASSGHEAKPSSVHLYTLTMNRRTMLDSLIPL